MACPGKSRTWAACLLLLALISLDAAAQPTLIIIIDDLGNDLEAGEIAVALPGKVNLAILPNTPSAASIAELGLAAGQEVLLHIPMSNLNERPLGAGALTEDMSEQELRVSLAESIASTPGARGINNHMGSLLTTQRQPMEWVMEELAGRGLYYVDSRTNPDTVAAKVAGEYGIPHLSRHVFLDNDEDPTAIHYQFREFLATADREGMAIAIGHPYRSTLKYLRRQMPRLQGRGYRLAFISEVLNSVPGSQALDKVPALSDSESEELHVGGATPSP